MKRLLLITCCLVALPAAQASAAPPTTIDFNGLAANETVQDQYASQGVRFGSAGRFGVPAPANDCGGGQALAGGISATSNQIACRTGSAEFPTRRFATTVAFSTERRRVDLKLQQRLDYTDSVTATVRALGIAGNVLATKTYTLNKNVTANAFIDRGSSDIAYLQVYGPLDYSDSGSVLVDDLVATLDDTPPPAKWALGLTTPSIDVVEGDTGTAGVVVNRFNGSSGPVTLSVPSLPPGVRSTSFGTNPVTGTDPAQLRITAGSPLGDSRQITVNATGSGGAGTGVVTSAVQTITGQPAVQIPSGGRFTRTVYAGCGPQRFGESFTVRGGYRGTVGIAPANATPSTSQYTAGSDGSVDYQVAVTPGAPGTLQTVTLNLAPAGATPASLDTAYRTVATSVRAIGPSSVSLSGVGRPDDVRIFGTFPLAASDDPTEGCPVTLVDPLGQSLAFRRTSTDAPGGGSEDTYDVTLPANAVPGPIRILGRGGVELARTAPVDVREFRNVHAPRQINADGGAGSPSYTWEEFQQVFGTDNTEICFIACVRDPVAAWQWADLRDSVRAYKGLCAGYAIMALRFAGAVTGLRPQTFAPNVSRGWDLTDYQDLRPLKKAVVRYFTSQRDRDLKDRLEASTKLAPAAKWDAIKQAIAKGGAYMTIRTAAGGHAVVGTGWQEVTNATTGQVELKVAVADSNQPFPVDGDKTERNDLATRNAALAGSAITVQRDGSWSGPASVGWSGPNGKLGVTRDIPDDSPELTTLASGLFLDFAGPAEVSGIESDGKPALRGDLEGQPGSGVSYEPLASGAGADRAWQLDRGNAYDVEVTGTGDGAFRQSAVGSGTTAGVSASLGKGRKGVVSLEPGKAAVGYDGPGGDATYEVNQKAGKATRSATVAMGADGRVALDGGGLTVRSTGGATTATVTLASAGTALPSSATTTVRVGAGQRVTVAPRSWKDVGGAVRVTVRNRKGKVVRRGRARLRTTRVVSLQGVRARRKGSTVTVSGRVGKRGTAPLLLAAVGKRAATLRGAQVKAGRFSLTIRKAPRGKRVVVKLLDEGANLVGVTRTVRAR